MKAIWEEDQDQVPEGPEFMESECSYPSWFRRRPKRSSKSWLLPMTSPWLVSLSSSSSTNIREWVCRIDGECNPYYTLHMIANNEAWTSHTTQSRFSNNTSRHNLTLATVFWAADKKLLALFEFLSDCHYIIVAVTFMLWRHVQVGTFFAVWLYSMLAAIMGHSIGAKASPAGNFCLHCKDKKDKKDKK